MWKIIIYSLLVIAAIVLIVLIALGTTRKGGNNKNNNSLYHIHQNLQGKVTNIHDVKDTKIYVVENFLSGEECEMLIKNAQGKMSPSPLTSPVDDEKYRDSETCYFTNNPLHNTIDNKICQFLGLGRNFSEDSQIQHYNTGNQFKPHHDFFHDNDFEGYAGKNSDFKGQRTWTFAVYLNDVLEGGNTEFVDLGIKIEARRGRAVIWNNLNKDGTENFNTLHCGKPVEKGEKYIVTKWFRDREQKK